MSHFFPHLSCTSWDLSTSCVFPQIVSVKLIAREWINVELVALCFLQFRLESTRKDFFFQYHTIIHEFSLVTTFLVQHITNACFAFFLSLPFDNVKIVILWILSQILNAKFGNCTGPVVHNWWTVELDYVTARDSTDNWNGPFLLKFSHEIINSQATFWIFVYIRKKISYFVSVYYQGFQTVCRAKFL